MRNIALIRKSLVLLAALIALSALGRPSTAFADGTRITPIPSWSYIFAGNWSDSGVTLAEAVPGTPDHTSILISDRYLLREGWLIKVDSESMLIEQLIPGGWGNPDTMVVERGVNGSVASPHALETMIQAHSVTVNIYAIDVTDYWGLGAFQIGITIPPEVQLIKMTYETDWLTSTGRDASWCDGPYQNGDTWWVTCPTMGNPEDGRYPLGPKGYGLIAKVTVLPPEDMGTSTFSLVGQLANTPSNVIPSTTHDYNMTMLECPDANPDGFVDSGDLYMVAANFGDEGVDSGATLDNQVNTSQTVMAISDQSALHLGDTIGIDAEQMTVTALDEGTPDTVTVTRTVNETFVGSHSAGTHIYRATIDGNGDGRRGYTAQRDVNPDSYLDSGDMILIAMTVGSTCPEP